MSSSPKLGNLNIDWLVQMNLDEFRFPLFKDRIFQIARIFKACIWGLEVRTSLQRFSLLNMLYVLLFRKILVVNDKIVCVCTHTYTQVNTKFCILKLASVFHHSNIIKQKYFILKITCYQEQENYVPSYYSFSTSYDSFNYCNMIRRNRKYTGWAETKSFSQMTCRWSSG